MVMTIKTRMDRDEFQGYMGEHGLTCPDACALVYIHSEAVIAPQEVHKAFDRHGYLSAPMTAAFRLLFKRISDDKKRV